MGGRYVHERSIQQTKASWGKLKDKLKAMPEKVVRKVLRDALTPGAKRVLGKAIAYCPRDTGKLAASIELQKVSTKKEVGYNIGAGNREKDGPWYAHLIENGYFRAARGKGKRKWRGSLKGKTKKLGYVPGKYFLSRALESEADAILNETTEALIKACDE